jgi:ribonuclease-3 family protein
MGYLYLADRFDRILELTVLGLDGLEKEEKLYQHH